MPYPSTPTPAATSNSKTNWTRRSTPSTKTCSRFCLDSGHCAYAGFDPVAACKRLARRIDYLHFKDVDPLVHARVIAAGVGFYDACAQGVFCKLGLGAVDFEALKQAVEESGFSGWAAIEQDCDPAGETSPLADARYNLAFLRANGIAEPLAVS